MEIGGYIIPRPKKYLILFLKDEVIWIAILEKRKIPTLVMVSII